MLARVTGGKSGTVLTKRKLYLSLVRSQLSYYSQLWRPYLLKDIQKLEQVQRRATKYIIGSNVDYKQRLISLNILPLMYYFELVEIMFLVNSVKRRLTSFISFIPKH